MTHDELLAYIDDSTNGLKHEHLFEKLITNTKALRAVVEYIKPNDWDFTDERYNKLEIFKIIERHLK
jgi:hypothetical protein